MKRGMPEIRESEQELQGVMRKQRDIDKRERLQMLYLIRSGQGKNRKEVARLLGVYRETVGDWVSKYEQGGLNKLLEIKRRGGSQSSLAPEVIEGMRKKLAQPEGIRTYRELLTWVKTTFSIVTTYFVVYYTATKILGARLAVGRKSHSQKKKVRKKLSNRALSLGFNKQC